MKARSVLAIVSAVCLVVTGVVNLAPAPTASAAGQVTLLFYDRNGNAMSITSVRANSDGQGKGYDNDALFDPVTLQEVVYKPLFTSGTNLAFNLTGSPVALGFNWETEPRGYSLIMLDNGGAGFTAAATVNFTYQAALDAKRRLDNGLAARTNPPYIHSAAFDTAYNSAVTHINNANGSSSDSVKGAEGQLALDQLAVANDTLLTDYGPAYAKAHLSTQTPWLGVNFDNATGYAANVDLANSLTNPYAWIQIVFDLHTSPLNYTDIITYAKSKGLKILALHVDSSYDKSLSRAQYLQRFQDYHNTFPTQIDAWDVGNEVNGSWLSTDIACKVADTAAYLKSVNQVVALTLFWQLNTDIPDRSMFNWARANLPASVRQNIDVYLLSTYVEQAPMGLAFDQIMTEMQNEFPGKLIGFGELGFWEKNQSFWWAFSQTDPGVTGRHEAERQFYNALLGYNNSITGGFWWYYVENFPGDSVFQSNLAAVRDSIGTGGGPTATPTSVPPTATPTNTNTPVPPTATPTRTNTPLPPTNTPTPGGPTATPTNTPLPPTATPTRTNTPVPPTATPTSASSGNTHSGTWAVKGVLSGSPHSKHIYQDLTNVATNTTYTASVWIKGTGSVQMNVWGGPTWSVNLSQTACNATSTWTQCVSPTFNNGANSSISIEFADAYTVAGTVYLDDAFLGSGANLLANADFESGNVSWTTSTTVFSIVQNP